MSSRVLLASLLLAALALAAAAAASPSGPYFVAGGSRTVRADPGLNVTFTASFNSSGRTVGLPSGYAYQFQRWAGLSATVSQWGGASAVAIIVNAAQVFTYTLTSTPPWSVEWRLEDPVTLSGPGASWGQVFRTGWEPSGYVQVASVDAYVSVGSVYAIVRVVGGSSGTAVTVSFSAHFQTREQSSGQPPPQPPPSSQDVYAYINFTAPHPLAASATVADPEGRTFTATWTITPGGWLFGYQRYIPDPTSTGCNWRTWSVSLRPLYASKSKFDVYRYWSSGLLDGFAGALTGDQLQVTVRMARCKTGSGAVYSYTSFAFSNGTHTVTACADTTWWSGCRFYAFKVGVHVTPLIVYYPLERFSGGRGDIYLPGESIPNPLFSCQKPEFGLKGRWSLTVSSPTLSLAQLADQRTWVWAYVYKNGSFAWAPVNDTWTLVMPVDWSSVAGRHCMPSNIVTGPWSDFPIVIDGAPSTLRGGHLIALAAWRPIYPETLSAPPGTNNSYTVDGVWLSNDTTLAIYNVTYVHESGRRYWQPIVVSTLRFSSAMAVYALSGAEHYYLYGLQRRAIIMRIEVNVTWKYLPPAWLSREWGFAIEVPHQEFGVALEAEGCASTKCIGYWAPSPARLSGSALTFSINLGDTEEFFWSSYPKGLGAAPTPTARVFQLSTRWLMVTNANPSGHVYGSELLKFTLAPASVIHLDWKGDRPVLLWACFEQNSSALWEVPGTRYPADLKVDWGDWETQELRGTAQYSDVTPPYTLPVDINPRYWVALYPMPKGYAYAITHNATIPVPLAAKYPPRRA